MANDVFVEAEQLRKSASYDEAEALYSTIINGINGQKHIGDQRDLLCQAYNSRGLVKYLKVDFDEAIEDYTKALNVQKTAVTYYNRGLIHYRLGRFGLAIEDMQEALKIDPSFESAQHCLQQSRLDKETAQKGVS